MEKFKQINIKKSSILFFNDMINIENFYSNLLTIEKKSYKEIDIFNIGYITIKKFGDCEYDYWFDRQIRRSFVWN